MNCPKCGEQNSDNSIYCMHCGEKFVVNEPVITEERTIEDGHEIKEEIARAPENIRNKTQLNKKKTFYIAIIASIIILVVIISIPMVIIPAKNYEKAVNLMEEKKYEESKQLFLSLDDYKSSKDYVSQIEAIQLFQQEKELVKKYLESNVAQNYTHVVSEVFSDMERITKSGTWTTDSGKAELYKDIDLVVTACDQMIANDIEQSSPVYELNSCLQKSAVYYKKAMVYLTYGIENTSTISITNASTNIESGHAQFTKANDEITNLANKYLNQQ